LASPQRQGETAGQGQKFACSEGVSIAAGGWKNGAATTSHVALRAAPEHF
jgi:hypothetical protein